MSLFIDTEGRLREIKVFTRPTADGRGSISFRTFIIEFPFNRNIEIDTGKLLAVETIKENKYLVLEVVDYLPLHYAMINLDGTIPKELRDEIMRRVEESWNSNESWIETYASPVGYIMEINDNNIKFTKGYIPPLLGSKIKLFTPKAYEKFIFYEDGENIGKVVNENIDLKISLRKAIKYHIGVFAYTGSGKSNLTALLVRKALESIQELKVIIIDVSMEYAVLLLDQLVKLNSRLITLDRLPNNEIDAGRRLIRTHVIPEELSDFKEEIRKAFEALYTQNKLRKLYIPPQGITYLTYGYLIEMVRSQVEDKYVATAQKPFFLMLLQQIDKLMREKKMTKDDIVDDSINEILNEVELKAREANLRENSAIFSFISAIKSYINQEPVTSEEYDIETLAIEALDNSSESARLFIVESPNMDDARMIVSLLIEQIFMRRKRSYSSSPTILFVLDEAQEFIPFDTKQKDNSEASSLAVEKLLRHGRKYYLHGLISTQRLAYLNTNVLQQIHTYFVSTLPRPYDRQLIAETFGVSDSLVEKTLEFDVGQWMIVSFKAALKEDIPVIFKAENNIDKLKEWLKKK
ncbi:ATP-binding protein [Sulfurisphaera tokodaii]|uniref:Serine/threonine-protein kinase n=2 Tax=Sulfurisphaera tokodaii TaxID=111955 RepID=Q976K9_SULTO|nr:ATP-binding protein [Sulfurisphaera tokodaii]BAB65138.1 serine/threonine-protein kinase [Sulfurisphaera tokodaii str. 7]HII74297.1 ATP-binding protein [Sulfurisphaera tokodaii]